MNATLRGFIRKEITQALRDPRMRILIFVVPFIQTSIFGLALSMEVRNIRLAIVSEPKDRIAARLAERSYASGWFVPVDARGRDPVDLLRSGHAEAVIMAPGGGVTRMVNRRDARRSKLQLLTDATNTLRAQSVARYLQAILAEITAEYAGGVKRPAPPPPIRFSVRTLFNPALRSPVFLVPGVMCMILCVTTILLTAMSLSREKELGTFEMLISAPVSPGEVLLGKTVPYVLLGLAEVPIILSAALFLFHVPFIGPGWMLALSCFVFVCATVAIGTLISSFARDQQQAMMGGFLFLFPAMLLSGLFFPLENMPTPLYHATWINPLRHFIVLLRNIMLKGGDPSAVAGSLVPLILITVAAIAISIRRFRQTLN